LVGETSRTFSVDATAPGTTLIAGAPDISAATDHAFAFTASEPASFQCRLDIARGGTWEGCGSPRSYGALSDGLHTFEVRAVDGVGNTDTSPAGDNFIVDTRAPAVDITYGPRSVSQNRLPSFGFSAEPGATLACSLDGGRAAFGPCSAQSGHSPATALRDGSWSFRVRATDEVGNTSVETRSFVIDATAPGTSFTAKPAKVLKIRSKRRKVAFAFRATEPARFRCVLNGTAPFSCASRITRMLKPGKHVITVAATDALGNVDASPARYAFQIKRIRR